MGPAGPGQSTLVFNAAGQAFSIPFNAAHLQQMQQATATTTMYSPDGTQYYQPVTQLTAQPTGPKMTRTDRLEVCFPEENNFCLIFPTILFNPLFKTVVSEICKCLSSNQARQSIVYIIAPSAR
jgi:hypothetical protein